LPRHPRPVLELIGVRASYGSIEVLHGVDLELDAGAVVALLGANGAGKSTILAVASGRLAPSTGCVHVAGRHVNGLAPNVLARAGVCTVPEGRAVFPNLTVRENLLMATYLGSSRREVEDRCFSTFPHLAERREQRAGRLSGGEQQMLAMARALVADPAVLLLDELSMGLAPRVVDELYEIVGRIASSGVAVLLTEQFAEAALRVAARVGLVVQGRLASFGSPAELLPDLATAYLGARPELAGTGGGR
jgi:branched-chain amino acid transport system ATP-binding protein